MVMRLLAFFVLALATSCAWAQVTSQLRAAIMSHLGATAKEPPIRFALTDLDGDHRDDALVLLMGPDWCGTGGCTLLVFRASEDAYAFVSESSVTRDPVRVGTGTSNGWRDLIVNTRGPGDVVLHYDGSGYPSNPSTLPAATRDEVDAANTVIGR
jgi:hypothetical protein